MNQYYETTDLPTATTLVALGVHLDNLDHSDPQRVKFLFRRVEGLDELLERFWNRTLTVEPHSYAMAQKYLKNRIYNS